MITKKLGFIVFSFFEYEYVSAEIHDANYNNIRSKRVKSSFDGKQYGLMSWSSSSSSLSLSQSESQFSDILIVARDYLGHSLPNYS